MAEGITWVGMDVHKRTIAVAILAPGARKPQELSLANEKRALARLARRLVREAPGEVRCCYEAGPCGYAVMRQLEAAAPLVCEVVAPALVPVRPGERIKTDRRDARKLAEHYRADQLTVVIPPTPEEEGVRDLVRGREDAKQDLHRSRNRLGKLLLRRGHIYPEGGRSWTLKYRSWLAEIAWEEEVKQKVVAEYLLAIEQQEQRMRRLEEAITELSQEAPYAEPVGWLRCFHGIDTVTAMTILAELHNFMRFERPRQLMAYLGMVPREHSSGERKFRGSLTKAGNSHVRRVIIEAAHHYRHRPRVSVRLRQRRQGAPLWAVAQGDRAHDRLYRKFSRLLLRGKPYGKVVAAVGRELVGFLWATLEEGRRRQQGISPPARKPARSAGRVRSPKAA